jgi:glycosyltransferase involved in cell wall biosynthesis
MNTIHIITGLETGGAENALYNVLRSGLADKHTNYVVSLGGMGTIGPKIQSLGIEVFAINMKGRIPRRHHREIIKKITQRFDPDIIQGWMYHGNIAALYASRYSKRRCKVVWNIRHSLYGLKHEKLLTRQIIRMNKMFSKKIDAIIYNSNVSKKQHEKFGFDKTTSLVISNGVDLDVFSRSLEIRKKSRKDLQISENSIVIGHVARLHPIKDHANFMVATTALMERNDSLEIVMVGRGVSYTTEKFSKYRDKKIHMLGDRNDVPFLMNAIDVLCQSSKSEAFPNVLIEAMATGVPCVATDVGDSRYILGETGIVVKPEDEEALSVGLQKLLDMDKDARHTMGIQARKRVEANFSITSTVKKYTDLYESLFKESS